MMFEIRNMQEQMIYDAVIKLGYSEEIAREIVYGESGNGTSEEDAAWVKSTVSRLENRFNRADVKEIRMNCQCSYGMDEKVKLLRELMETSSDLEQLAKQDRAKQAGLSYVDGELFLQFPFCPCPMLAGVDHLETDTWCQCTTGYSKVLFEKAFGCEADVELLKSIKMGHDICLMKIIPRGLVWKSTIEGD